MSHLTIIGPRKTASSLTLVRAALDRNPDVTVIGKPFGLQRVCQALDLPRSTIYAVRARERSNVTQLVPVRSSPKPKVPDHELFATVRADLARTSLVGDGIHKVLARLRIHDDIRVSRTRVTRLMREHGSLSPHPHAQRPPNAHDGRITTDRPNEMWSTDGTKVQTIDEGLVWIFAAVDHCDAACVGIQVTKVGDRFAALEPISQGLREHFGSTEADARRRLSLQMDHGSQYTSDNFHTQIKFWDVTPSYAFVAEPQTNGVAERFNRTMKEQAIHGRLFKNVAEVRAAVVAFKDRCNREWRLEKLGFEAPLGAHQAALLPLAADRKTVSKQPDPIHFQPEAEKTTHAKVID